RTHRDKNGLIAELEDFLDSESGTQRSFITELNAQRFDFADLFVDYLARQTIGGNPVTQHPARMRLRFEDRHLVPEQAEVVRAAQTCGPCADNRDGLVAL